MSKFIVIEGLDGSGKSTQLKLLTDYFRKNNLKYKHIHFPRMDSPIFGDLIARFLKGEFGQANKVNPYLVSLLFAGDRENAKPEINKLLSDNFYIIVDRYINSNIAFQLAKISNISDKEKLKNWILNLEYNYYKIPKPDISMFLHVPFSFITQKLNSKRTGDDRKYLEGKEDIHEKDLNLQQNVEKEYLKLIDNEDNFKIKCFKDKDIFTPPIIHEKIISLLKSQKIIL